MLYNLLPIYLEPLTEKKSRLVKDSSLEHSICLQSDDVSNGNEGTSPPKNN